MNSVSKTAETNHAPQMFVTKRNGTSESINVEKIVKAVSRLTHGLSNIDPMRVALKTIGGLYDGATTQELDQLSIRTAAALTAEEPEYGMLAARLLAEFIEKEVAGQDIHSFSQSITTGHGEGIVNDRVKDFVGINARKLNDAIEVSSNHLFEYFGLRTVYDRYLLRHPTSRFVFETPQYFFMRVACALGGNDITETLELYHQLSKLEYMTSSPTLFNAGTVHEQLSSCFLLDSPEDDLAAIYAKYADIAQLSKFAGGIGVSWSRIRSRGSHIKGTNGHSNGIVPWLKTLDSSVQAVNQGGRRKGAACVYVETWHADIEEFLELRDNTGDHDRRTHNLNLSNWIPDEFMRRVEANAKWSMFDPKDVPMLVDTYGMEFDAFYLDAEAQGLAKKTVPARELYSHMLRTLAQTGNGWINFKDRCNETSNQTAQSDNIIHLSNLCVAPDTTILTREAGAVVMSENVGKSFTIWNGEMWSKDVEIVKTGENQPLLHVVLDNDFTLDCTEYHKWYLQLPDSEFPNVVEVRTTDLKPGDQVYQGRDALLIVVNEPRIVQSVTDEGRVDDTYCVSEPLRHRAVFNGILTGQCTEILEVTSAGETAVCNLGSINLSRHMSAVGLIAQDPTKTEWAFDFDKLSATTRLAVRQLNRVIDLNYYPIDTAATSNQKWRPIGLGLMGLQDVFFKLGLPFDSAEALALSNKISEHIYFHALSQSNELAMTEGFHPSFADTRAAGGDLQFDHWKNSVQSIESEQWNTLRTSIREYGLRNSLMIAIAPTATIASICGCYECTEPQISNLFKRETLSGDFLVINKYLVTQLKTLDLWTPIVRDKIKMAEGSIQGIEQIPEAIRQVYRTVWETPQKALIDMAAGRGAYIDQSQSLNLFAESPNIGQLSSMYMYAWKQGIKTTYYLRSRPATKIAKTTVSDIRPASVGVSVQEVSKIPEDVQRSAGIQQEDTEAVFCSLENPGSCEACS